MQLGTLFQMEKRGQVTIFIIVGILILATVMGIFQLQKFKTEEGAVILPKQQRLLSQSKSVQNYVNSCLESVAKKGIVLLGIQGGRTTLSEDIFSTATWSTSYLYFDEENRLPALKSMEQDLATYIEENIEKCTNFGVFESLKVEPQEKKAKVTVESRTVSFDLYWPLYISMEDLQKTLEYFNVKISLEFSDVYNTVNNIIKATEKHPNIVDNLLLLHQNVTFIDYIVEDDDKVIYLITEENSGFNQPYYFLFAVKKLRIQENQPPIINEIPHLEAIVGELFIYQILASDPEREQLSYSLRSALFYVEENTGKIIFTPTVFERGDHFLPLTVQDVAGNTASKIVQLSVISEDSAPEIIVVNKTAIKGEESRTTSQ